MTTIQVFSSDDELAAHTADFIVSAARDAISARGRFSIALTGGSSPQKAYTLLAQSPRTSELDWTKTDIFFGDDRYVPPSDERSNFGMASRLLLKHVPLPEANVYPMPVEAEKLSQAPGLYADTLAQYFGISAGSRAAPQFDLILLGLGDDGHIASLFPGMPTLQVMDRWVVASPAGTLPPPVDRISLTYPVLNAARQVLFIVNGDSKADAVRDVLEGGAPRERRPAAGVQPTSGGLTWYSDRGAAHLLDH